MKNIQNILLQHSILDWDKLCSFIQFKFDYKLNMEFEKEKKKMKKDVN